MAVVLVVAGAYGLVRFKRAELVDFAVPRRAAVRFLAQEPLYRPDDGHFQYKYLPAFAQLMVPFTWVSKEVEPRGHRGRQRPERSACGAAAFFLLDDPGRPRRSRARRRA